MNNAYQASTQDTPFYSSYLNYGKHRRLPRDLTLSSERKKAVKVAKAVDSLAILKRQLPKPKSTCKLHSSVRKSMLMKSA